MSKKKQRKDKEISEGTRVLLSAIKYGTVVAIVRILADTISKES